MAPSIRPAVGAALVLFAALALAHPGLVSSTPKSGEVLDAVPKEMRLKFNEPVEAAFTSVKVVDSAGKEFSGDTTQVDKSDASSVVVALPALPRGAYKARWAALGR